MSRNRTLDVSPKPRSEFAYLLMLSGSHSRLLKLTQSKFVSEVTFGAAKPSVNSEARVLSLITARGRIALFY